MSFKHASLKVGIVMLLSCAMPAHSEVTIFGLIDTAASTVTSSGPGSSQRRNQFDSGVGLGSRLGIRATEDLGGGLRANVWLEQGLTAQTGALQQGGLAFGRQSYVGLASKNWSLNMGRQYSPLNLTVAAADAFGQGYWGNSQGTGVGQHSARSTPADGGFQAPARVNNSVLLTVTERGLSARLMLSSGDAKGNAGRSIGASLTYSEGPIYASVAYHKERQFAADLPEGASPAWQDTWAVGGMYDFGRAKIYAGYYRYTPSTDNVTATPATTLRSTSAWVGTRLQITDTGTLIGQIMQSRYSHPEGVQTGQALTLGLAYEHLLSKRTGLYAAWGRVNNNATSANWLWASTVTAVPAAPGTNVTALSFGMWHRF